MRLADADLIPLAEKLPEVPQQLIRTALGLELQEGTVIADRVGETPCLFLASLHWAERTIAVFSMPSFIAMASAVLKPMPRISRARR